MQHPRPSILDSRSSVLLAVVFLACLPSLARSAWETGWPYRRAVLVDFAPDRLTGEDVAFADLYTAGHHERSGENIRVTTEQGAVLPARLLMIGPGDMIRVAFALRPPNKRYYVYFGNPNAPAQRPADQLAIRGGLLLEMRKLDRGRAGGLSRIDNIFDNSKTLIGRTLLGRLYTGVNPFGEQTDTITKYSGVLRAPADGSYTFAASASDRGALYLDGKQLLLVPGSPHDTRFNASVDLRRGPHDIVFYQESLSGLHRLSVVWKTPNSENYELVPAEAFGLAVAGLPGPMEQKDKSLTADFQIEYLGECFFADHYTHRYRFTAQTSRTAVSANPKFDWDLGDGQTATGPTVEHVYLTSGRYPIKLTAKLGAQADNQTNRLVVSRCYERLDNPPTDTLRSQAAVLANYDLSKMVAADLAWATTLHARTKGAAPLERAASRLAAAASAADSALALRALQEASEELLAQSRLAAAIRAWEDVPANSPLQPRAARELAELLLWYAADFSKAVKALEPHVKQHPNDRALLCTYGQALLLDQKAPEAKKILRELAPQGPDDRQAAISGALARTIEFYIAEKDAPAGQDSWRRWQHQYPADFLEGYSLLLQTRLMELVATPAAAAKVAEAFATAMPKSSYSPRLLDRASRLIEKSDLGKSKALRSTLKQKYPEDPLSQ